VLVIVLVLAAGLVPPVRRNLPRLGVALSAVGLLGFSLANPDRLIASRDVARWRATGQIDVSYVRSLSADAVTPLAMLAAPLRSEALGHMRELLAHHEPWSSANLARHRARATLATLQP
jgi:hypothetical protein